MNEPRTGELRDALLKHYDRAARALPWRGEADPYRILVSEVMLQQTRVETVKRFYGRWLEQFPNLGSLAVAEEDEVLKAWEGLGYYRRARNLHRAAMAVHESSGALPESYAELRTLPGVGEYTAGAVSSIAFGEVAPAVDGNARRVLARLFDVADPKAAWLRETATALVDPERPGDWNQALMELGATVCTPRSPRCGECPLRTWCGARLAGTQAERPTAKEKRTVPEVLVGLGVFHADGHALLVRRPEDGLLGGMWAFPECEAPAAAALDLCARLGLAAVNVPRALPRRRHRFTHLHAEYAPWAIEVTSRPVRDGWGWTDPLGETAMALPVAQRRVLESWAASASRSEPGSRAESELRSVPHLAEREA